MKKLTKEEADKISILKRGRSSPTLEFAKSLKVGESALLPKEEWKLKTKPSVILCSNMRNGMKFSCKQTKDKNGWLITRII